uniref:Prosaposin n=1 Tax=Ciona savignyi TaxID=51511 RepID=H2ZIM5_CIOSA
LILYYDCIMIVSVHGVALGADRCTWGPSYWCKNYGTAKTCGSVKHCKTNYWNKPVKNDEICNLCKEGMTVVDNYLKANATKAAIEAELLQICSDIPIPDLSTQCKQLITENFDMIYDEGLILVGNGDMVCTLIGLCTSSISEGDVVKQMITESDLVHYVLNMVKCKMVQNLMNILSVIYPIVRLKKNVGNAKYCTDCTNYMKDLQDVAANNKSIIAEIIAAVEKVCTILPSNVQVECRQLIDQYGSMIINLLAQEVTPAELCGAIKLCTSLKVFFIFSNFFYPSMFNYNPVTLLSSLLLFKVSDSTVCDLCKLVAEQLDNLLTNNSTEAEIVAAVEKVCTILPSSVEVECRQLIDQYGSVIINLLAQEVTPSKLCDALGLCTSFKTAAFKSGNGELCDVCKLIIQFLDQQIGSNATSKEVETALDQICAQLPASFKQTCDDFVMQYAPEILKMLDNIADPDYICLHLDLCPGKAAHQTLIGANPCTFGPSYWCKNQQTAVECNAVSHCEKHVWE